jgi:TPR repeat protein
MYNLGVLYARGQGVLRDDIEAFKWLDLAADMGIGEDHDKALRVHPAGRTADTCGSFVGSRQSRRLVPRPPVHLREMID